MIKSVLAIILRATAEPNHRRVLAGRPDQGLHASHAVWIGSHGTRAELVTVHGGGHTLPQRHVRFPRILGATYVDLDGPGLIKELFQRTQSQQAAQAAALA
jgi:poly(3-hydroxybutyrate) depolymerase